MVVLILYVLIILEGLKYVLLNYCNRCIKLDYKVNDINIIVDTVKRELEKHILRTLKMAEIII